MVVFAGIAQPTSAQAQTDITDDQVKGSNIVAEVDPILLEQLADRGQAKALVYLREQVDLTPAFSMSWQTRGHFVHQQLTETATRSQARVKNHLNARAASWQAFWIANVIVVRQADATLIEELRHMPEVRAIRAEPEIILIQPEHVEPADSAAATTPVGRGHNPEAGAPQPDPPADGTIAGSSVPAPNLTHLGAPQVWADGHTGQGITIGIIDTGVRYTHNAIVNQYRGNLGNGSFDHNYHWWDPYQPASSIPFDNNGHGTHVTGTVLGDDGGQFQFQTGMAPDARWMACAALPTGGGTPEGLLGCGQFMLAPTNLAGANADPGRRPHAVNNSWGDCDQVHNPWYEGVIDAWIAAGIVPVFANGNSSNCGYSSPPGLNTVGNPARSGKVLSIGSTGADGDPPEQTPIPNGQYADHSNWGPTDNPNPGGPLYPEHGGYPQLKPNIVAPGVWVLSAYALHDDSYAWSTGTSMSAPHVAGLVALMLDAAPCLAGDHAALGTILQQTATPIPYASGGSPAPGPGNVPNYATGWGEIDAVTAVAEAKIRCGPHGRLIGRVTSAVTGSPIANVRVTIDTPHGTPEQHHVWTDGDGRYRHVAAIAQPPGEGYTLTFTHDDNYGTATVTGVHVAADADQVVDAELDAGFLVLPEGIAVTVPEGGTAGVAVGLNNAGTLATPVALELFAGLYEDFEGSFPPPGWSLDGDPAADCGWARNDAVAPAEEPIEPAHGGRPNFAGGAGFAAVADADACGPGSRTDAILTTPPIDLSAAEAARLDFLAAYYHLGASAFIVSASGDGGISWEPHLDWRKSVHPWGPGEATGIDLSAYLGQPDTRLRFHYSGLWDWWAQIDQVRLIVNAPWASLSATQLDVPPGATAAPQLTVDSAPLAGLGQYRLLLKVEHTTPEQHSPVLIPIVVNVVPEEHLFADGFEGFQP